MKNAFIGVFNYYYVPTIECIDRANKFGILSDKNSSYGKKRGQTDAETRVFQHAIGKIGELAVVDYLKKHQFKILKDVDWNIYPANERNWDPDIIVFREKELSISVKTSIGKYGGRTEYLDGEPISVELPKQHSYTFQLKDNSGTGGTDKLETDICAFCNLSNRYNKEIKLYGWMRMDMVKKMMIRPFKKELKDLKGCIMMETCGGFRDFPCGLGELNERARGLNEKHI